MEVKNDYRISSYSFCGNYSFLDLEIQRSQHINVRKLFKGGNYMRKYGILYKGYGKCQPKSQKLLLVLLENAGKVLKGRKGFRNAGKVLKMQERF